MAALTTQSLVYAGTAPTFGAVGASDTADVGNGRNTFLVYKNVSGSNITITLTLPTTGTPYTETVAATVAYTVALTNGERWIPLHSDYAGADGRVTITSSSQSNISVAVVRADWSE